MLCGPPIFLSDRYIDLPLTFEEVARVAAMAPPEVKRPKSTRQSKRGKGSVVDRAAKYLAAIDPAVSGQHGHDATYRAACTLVVDFDLSIDDARPILQEFNARCQPPWSEDEVERKLTEADKSSGERGKLAAGASQFPQREIMEFDTSQNTFEPIELLAPEVIVLPSLDDCPLVDPENPLLSFGFPEIETATDLIVHEESPPLSTVPMNWMSPRVEEGRTDIANGKRLARILRGKAKYIVAWDSWIVWDGKRWKLDDLGVRELAKEIPATILADAMKEAPISMDACNWAILSASRARIEAAIAMAKSDRGISIDHSQLDADPWLMNCQNGIVDLRTGQLTVHDPEKLITKITAVDYDPDSESYEWDRFLEKILVDESLIVHVQRLIGYCCTGSTREQIMPIFWGEGSNGKSTLLDTIKAALGVEYASTAPPSLIMAKKMDSHPTELACLHGKRMVTAVESEKGQKLNEPLVKQLTGGDSIMARRMKENFWEFRPTHKLVLCTNHEPRVGDDHAIWRRIVMIPFKQQFWNPEKGESGPADMQRDNDLPARLERCLKGVLAWAVRGAIDWYREGLAVDQGSREATVEYRKRQDPFCRFVEEYCITGNQYRSKFSDLYGYYETWANDAGEHVHSKKSFGDWLTSKKFEKQRSMGVWIVGLTWKPEYDKSPTFE